MSRRLPCRIARSWFHDKLKHVKQRGAEGIRFEYCSRFCYNSTMADNIEMDTSPASTKQFCMTEPTEQSDITPDPPDEIGEIVELSSDDLDDHSDDPDWVEPGQFSTDLATTGENGKPQRRRRRLHCFECNRSEGHFLASQHRWFYSYLLGLTFGSINIAGPYQCQCCGAKRLMAFNLLNPRYWFRSARRRKLAKPRSRGR